MEAKTQTAILLAVIPLVVFVSNMVVDGIDKHEQKPCHDDACIMLEEMSRNIAMNNCLVLAQLEHTDFHMCLRINASLQT